MQTSLLLKTALSSLRKLINQEQKKLKILTDIVDIMKKFKLIDLYFQSI